ncbi:LolA family protein [Desulfurobacterium sp.]
MRKLLYFMVALVLLVITNAEAENNLISFIEGLKRIRTLEISFVQITRLDPDLKEKDIYEGTIYYKRPSKFKWVYTKNSKMEIISDGKVVFTCIPKEKKLLKSSLKEGIDYLPIIRILESPQKFGNYFRIVSDAKLKNKVAFELVPLKDNVSYKQIIVVFEEDKTVPLSFQVLNDDGSDITYIIESWKENIKLPDTIFKLDRCHFKEDR